MVRAYDPEAMEKARPVLPIEYGKDAYEAAEGAEALLIATEWPEFRKLDWGRVRDSMVQAADSGWAEFTFGERDEGARV